MSDPRTWRRERYSHSVAFYDAAGLVAEVDDGGAIEMRGFYGDAEELRAITDLLASVAAGSAQTPSTTPGRSDDSAV